MTGVLILDSPKSREGDNEVYRARCPPLVRCQFTSFARPNIWGRGCDPRWNFHSPWFHVSPYLAKRLLSDNLYFRFLRLLFRFCYTSSGQINRILFRPDLTKKLRWDASPLPVWRDAYQCVPC